MPREALGREARGLGLGSVETRGKENCPTVRRLGLTCPMPTAPSPTPVGFNRPDQHDRLVAESERLLPIIAGYGFPNMIVFSGNRGAMADGEGIEHCVTGIRRIVPAAERHGVTVCMELLNSKVDHPDYQCDHTAWGAEVVKRVNSPRFKLLYDIYHMQIMEGDVIRTIRDNFAFLAHFHTGGGPGRHQIAETPALTHRR